MKKISDIFKRLSQEKNQKKIFDIVEKGLHQIVYEVPDQPELIIKFVTNALQKVNLEKGILDTVKRLRIFDEAETR